MIPDKNTAFKLYKYESDFSKETETNIKTNIENLKNKKNEARELLKKSQDLKSQIDEIKVKLNEKKQNKLNLADEMTNVIDEEECQFLDDLKARRDEYKEVVNNFNKLKEEMREIKDNIEMMKVKYVENFENWFLEKYGIAIDQHELMLAKARYGVNVEEEKEKEKQFDPDEEAYMNAKKKIQNIHKAKKMDKLNK